MEVEENPLALLSEEQVMAYLGTYLKDPVVEGHEIALQDGLDLPINFDGRQQWGSCVHGILNQARCGSCWAFGASEALSDRFCIQSSRKIDNVLSSQDMVSCDTGNMACQGGWLDRAWDYLSHTGIVTEACWKYTSMNG